MSRLKTPPSPSRLRAQLFILVALGPFALGYFLSYLFRAVNAIVAPNLIAEIGIEPAELGFLTAAYLLGFAAVQLPLGVMLDRYGPRRVQAVLLTLGALGALLFGLGTSLWMLSLARAVIGISFAGALMAGFKAVVIWVPETRRATANSCVMAFGALGVIVATVPAELAIQAIGWRGLFFVLSAVTLAVAALIAFVVPERQGSAATGTLGEQFGALRTILGSRIFWRLAPILSLTTATFIAIQTLWAGPWFGDVAGLDRSGVALHLLILALSFLAGVLLIGFVTDWLHGKGVSRLRVMTGFLAAFLVSQFLIIWGPSALAIPSWILFGLTGQGAIIAFPWLATHYGATMAGRANTALNLFIFITAWAVQYFIGVIIQLFVPDQTGAYPLLAYQTAFGICLALQVAAFGWYLRADPTASAPGST